jgi:hypothetical protein
MNKRYPDGFMPKHIPRSERDKWGMEILQRIQSEAVNQNYGRHDQPNQHSFIQCGDTLIIALINNVGEVTLYDCEIRRYKMRNIKDIKKMTFDHSPPQSDVTTKLILTKEEMDYIMNA